MPNFYPYGTLLEVKATFRNKEGVLTNPSTVTLKVTTPAGVTTDYTWVGGQVTNDSVGIFTRNLDLNQANTWRYRFIGTGSAQGSAQAEFRVQVPNPA